METSDAKENEQEEMMQIRSLVERDDSEVAAEWEASDDQALNALIIDYRNKIHYLSSKLQTRSCPPPGEAEIEAGESEWTAPPHSIAIEADVRTYDWSALYNDHQFDVIVMDPPWQLATSNPTRGVALTYGQLTNRDIVNIPVQKLQSSGLLFLWVINSSFDFAMTLFETWNYKLVDELVWVKLTVNRRLAKSHGYYLQHAKEVCLIGMKGTGPQNLTSDAISDVILSERRGQSQKPDEIYDLIEALVPNGKYLEIFARRNNLRNHWFSLGDEVHGVPLGQTEEKE